MRLEVRNAVRESLLKSHITRTEIKALIQKEIEASVRKYVGRASIQSAIAEIVRAELRNEFGITYVRNLAKQEIDKQIAAKIAAKIKDSLEISITEKPGGDW